MQILPVMNYPTLLAKTKWKQTVPAEEPSPSSPSTGTVTNYPSLSAAVQPILAQHPQVIAFGEFHPEWGFTYQSTIARFTEEVLPQLATEGICHLLFERILTDPVIEAELETFYSTNCEIDQEHTPTLLKYIEYADQQDVIKLLKKARELGIRIHPGGMSIEQALETIKNENYLNSSALRARAACYAGIALKNAVKNLLGQNQEIRLAVYSGLPHNNINPLPGQVENGINFGQELSQTLGEKYIEVDLVLPVDNTTVDLFVRIPNWRDYIPPEGVTAVQNGRSYTLFFPRN